ncbi:MAG: hypothetical protein QOG52_804 [Frankiaceae bacterium]|nr:hypothetical protein [Frankiaceae bacterium]
MRKSLRTQLPMLVGAFVIATGGTGAVALSLASANSHSATDGNRLPIDDNHKAVGTGPTTATSASVSSPGVTPSGVRPTGVTPSGLPTSGRNHPEDVQSPETSSHDASPSQSSTEIEHHGGSGGGSDDAVSPSASPSTSPSGTRSTRVSDDPATHDAGDDNGSRSGSGGSGGSGSGGSGSGGHGGGSDDGPNHG